MFGASEGTNVHFICGGMTWDIHSFVLQLGSKVLAAKCSGPFQVGVSHSPRTGSTLSLPARKP